MSRFGHVWEFKPGRASGSNGPRNRSKAQTTAMENLFPSLETKRLRGRTYRSRDQARADVFDHIERFSDPIRRHSIIKYLSHVPYEEKAMKAYLAATKPAAGHVL